MPLGKQVYDYSVFGWHFLNGKLKLSWKEFHRKLKQRRTAYHWQVHHTNQEPSRTLAEHLQIVTHSRNQREQKTWIGIPCAVARKLLPNATSRTLCVNVCAGILERARIRLYVCVCVCVCVCVPNWWADGWVGG